MKGILMASGLIVAAGAAATAAFAGIERFNPPGLYHSKHYTQATAAEGGRVIHISGQWAYDEAGEVQHRGDLTGQAVLACQNLRKVLAAAGGTPEDVVKINVYIKDYKMADLVALEAGVTECFGPRRDFASTLVGVQSLALDGMLFEIEAIAVVGASPN